MKPKKNALEWTIFGVSAILIVVVVATLVSDGMNSPDTPPSLEVMTGSPERNGAMFRVPVEVRNSGNETAEQARIEIELLERGTIVERAELTIAFVPKRSKREGWVVFRNDPRCCEVTARASSFGQP